jgi:phosphoribosyl 1,2-cyclic phosphate phosphodiesterase
MGDTTLVFDTGPDFRQQMIRARVKRLDAVLYTHCHRDHTAGLDDTRSFVFRQDKAMDVYGDADTLRAIQLDFRYVFAEHKYPGIPDVRLHEVGQHSFRLGDHEIIPVPVMHLQMPVLGFRIGNFAYITDANFIPDSSMSLLQGLEVLVLNALQRKPHISHFTLDQAIEVSQKLHPRKTFFTHISHKLGLHAEVSQELPPGIELAFDGLVVDIN